MGLIYILCNRRPMPEGFDLRHFKHLYRIDEHYLEIPLHAKWPEDTFIFPVHHPVI
jgi:hypothetical protein